MIRNGCRFAVEDMRNQTVMIAPNGCGGKGFASIAIAAAGRFDPLAQMFRKTPPIETDAGSSTRTCTKLKR